MWLCFEVHPHDWSKLGGLGGRLRVLVRNEGGIVPRWVTVFGRVNHLGVEPGTQAYSA